MFDSTMLESMQPQGKHASTHNIFSKNTAFRITKRLFDVVMSALLLPFLFIICLIILVLNVFFNSGPLFFVQPRMGRHCKSFKAIKFRTMRTATGTVRAADDPLELDRITQLGYFLRKSRVDELPQIINVLLGHMSLIGPRPDFFDHAVEYAQVIPGYKERHAVRPGISGLAQTELGYAEGLDATARKVKADLYYISHRNFRMEAWIFWRTLSVVARRAGA